MTQITIPNEATEVTYNLSSSSTGPFTVPFSFLKDEHVLVEITDNKDLVTDLVVTTGFTFDSYDNPAGQEGSGHNGGVISLVLAVGSDLNTDVKIYRSTIVDRSSNYPDTGPFSMPLLNDEQNKFIAIMQEIVQQGLDDVAKAVQVDGSSSMTGDLDLGGNDILDGGQANVDALYIGGILATLTAFVGTNIAKTYTNVAGMVAASDLIVGDIAMTAGFITSGDKKGAIYRIVAAATGTNDGQIYIDLSGISGQANLISAVIISHQTTTNLSYHFGALYGTMDTTLVGSYMFGGTQGSPNKMGVNNTKPLNDPSTHARVNDTAYVTGVADVSGLLAGYDNVVNCLAGLIASQHSILYHGSDHASIWGGSLHSILTGATYAAIVGGTSNTIEAENTYAAIICGSENTIEDGPTLNERGFRGLIIGGNLAIVGGRNGIILGGSTGEIIGTYGTIINGNACTIGLLSNHATAVGLGIKIGETGQANYSCGIGINQIIDAGVSFAAGSNNTIGVDHTSSSAFGSNCKTGHIGSHVESSRSRDSVIGNNQALRWCCNQETTDTTTTHLSLASVANYPLHKADSIIDGTIYIIGVNTATGACSSFEIAMTTELIGSGTPTIRHNVTTTKYNGLSIVTVPTIVVTSSNIYRVQVVGIAATNIAWNAVFYGHETVFTP